MGRNYTGRKVGKTSEATGERRRRDEGQKRKRSLKN